MRAASSVTVNPMAKVSGTFGMGPRRGEKKAKVAMTRLAYTPPSVGGSSDDIRNQSKRLMSGDGDDDIDDNAL